MAQSNYAADPWDVTTPTGGYVSNNYGVNAPNTLSSTFPTPPTPPLNLNFGSSVNSSVLGNGTTMPITGKPVSWAPTLASPAGMSDMSSYLRTPTGMDSVPTYNFGDTGSMFSGTQPSGFGQSSLFSGVSGLETPMQLDSGMFSVMNQPAATPSWGDWASKNKELISGGVGLATAGLGAFNAWNSNQTAKDQLKFQKESFGKQYEAQKGLTNSQLEDRQRRRVAEQPNLALGVDEYMNKYGVK